MIAGGLGNVRRKHVEKSEIPVGAKIVVLGGPAMLIGLGGGAASSMGSGASSADLDFASVQRGNPEIQRRAQEVIDRCSRALDAESDPADPRRRRGRSVERRARSRGAHAGPRRASSTWRRFRTTSPACRPWSCGATSRRSATCCIIDAAQARRLRGHRAARALPVRGDRRDRRHRRAGARRQAARHAPGRPAARSVVRQGAEDAARRAPRDAAAGAAAAGRHRSARSRLSAAAFPGGGRQDLPDFDRRSHRRRHDQPRPDGRALAGAGGRRRGHDRPTTSATPAKRWPWASARRWRCSTRRRRAGSRWARRSPTFSRPTSARCRTCGCPPTGWRPAASPAKTRRCTPRCTPWAKSCVRRWASRFRWARIRCR